MRQVLLAVCAAALMSVTAVPGMVLAAPADPNRLFPDSRMVVADRISVEVVGKGPDLILIPGLASSRTAWKATAERLKDHYRLHLVQVAGFAGEPSRANAQGEVLAPTEEAIDAYILQQKLAPATVIAHSLGGTMVLMLAERHPQDLKKAMMVDSLPFYGMAMAGPMATPANVEFGAARTRDSMLNASDAQYRAMGAQNVAGMISDPKQREMAADWVATSDRTVVARAMYEDLQTDLRPDLAKVSTPMVLLYPDYTPVGAPAGAMTQMYPMAFAKAPSVKAVEVQHSLHFIMLDQPAVFDKAVDDFLGR